ASRPEGEDQRDGRGERRRDEGQDDDRVEDAFGPSRYVRPDGHEREGEPEGGPDDTDHGGEQEAVPERLTVRPVAGQSAHGVGRGPSVQERKEERAHDRIQDEEAARAPDEETRRRQDRIAKGRARALAPCWNRRAHRAPATP